VTHKLSSWLIRFIMVEPIHLVQILNLIVLYLRLKVTSIFIAVFVVCTQCSGEPHVDQLM
jgi:hypothetical protein